MNGNFWAWVGWIVTNLIMLFLAENIGGRLIGKDKRWIARYVLGIVVMWFIYTVLYLQSVCFTVIRGGW